MQGLNLDDLKARGLLTEATNERFELFGVAHAFVEKRFNHRPSVKIDGNPEGQSTKHLHVFLGKVFGNPLGRELCCLAATLLSLP